MISTKKEAKINIERIKGTDIEIGSRSRANEAIAERINRMMDSTQYSRKPTGLTFEFLIMEDEERLFAIRTDTIGRNVCLIRQK